MQGQFWPSTLLKSVSDDEVASVGLQDKSLSAKILI